MITSVSVYHFPQPHRKKSAISTKKPSTTAGTIAPVPTLTASEDLAMADLVYPGLIDVVEGTEVVVE